MTVGVAQDAAVAVVPAPAPQAPSRRFPAGRVLRWAMVLVVVALLPFVWNKLPDPRAMWSAATTAHPVWLTVVIAGAAASMGMFAWIQRRLLRIGGVRMSGRRMTAITFAGNALSTTLPAGPAVSVVYTFQQFRRGGANARLATAVIIVGGLVTSAAYTAIALVALLAEPRVRLAALAGLAVPVALVLAAWPRPVRRRLAVPVRAVLAHRRIAPWAERLRDGLAMLRPTRRDWGALVLFAALNWVFDILALYAAVRAVGLDISPVTATLVYFAAQAAGSMLPVLPGGLGAIEGSMAAALVALGAALTPAAAAVAVYRLASFWSVVAVGYLAWLALHDGPRVPAKARALAAGAGRATLAGLRTAAAQSAPCPVSEPHRS
ncbi:lysylphosphatidylglycerol synthase transmembrane domain-containing protein [Actinomadura flavalba]|uniref:lysylphosphatidylglycerol synthase transmembrane domain-containing protein n=1 Tax=Actinomadura flavalba TaxID=1120938 RepID=UPI000366A1EF|nr:lysylphosphatidylglycerol synthase transmembrane domain-containing protein [Actinomadura flavalba]